MTPYYQDDAVTIYHGDCMDVLPTLTDVGLVLTSPPYNLNRAKGSEWSALGGGYDTHGDSMPHCEYVKWQQEVLATAWEALADDGAIYFQHKPIAKGNESRLPLELIPEGVPLRQIVIWDRGSGFQRTHWHYVPRQEWVMVLAKPAFRLTTLDVDDVWRIPFETGNEHPAPFPLRLATLAIGTTKADVVVDPFMGSGTTLRAAKDLNRKAIGIELSERYCEIAAKRMAQEVLPL